MAINSLLQLSLSLQAVLLGWAMGLLYDLLRALRLRCKKAFAASALDVLYGLSVLILLFFFALRVSGGELRVYQLLCFLGGLVFFFAACSVLLRPLWEFWADVLLDFVALCLLPFRFLHRLAKSLPFTAKNSSIFKKSTI